jgi:hypothetical protein
LFNSALVLTTQIDYIVAKQKSNTLKLAPILAQYLYDQKKLDLAGIGIFLLDPSLRTESDARHASQGISFQYNPATKDDERLISYISLNTGKQKALATSDLSSYLELATQFLNIGKPFQIEGIGTLVKTKSGLEFTADHVLTDKTKEANIKELSSTSTSDQSFTTYESLKPHVEKDMPHKNIFLVLLILVSTGIIIWAGYKMYKSRSSGNNDNSKTEVENKKDETVPATDSSQFVTRPVDTMRSVKPNENTSPGNYRFVIEVANKRRAFYRYDMLKKGGLPIQMSTPDSITFKLFFVLAAKPADTGRISDSLSVVYPAINHKKAFAEK